MKVVILAGGFGTRISEESVLKPKPLLEIGGKPIIWHIMKYYSKYGLNDFIILGGFKHKVLQNYFNKNKKKFSTNNLNWKIKVVNTGKNTMTGGRLKRIKNFLSDNEDFCLTYGDGLSDVNIKQQINEIIRVLDELDVYHNDIHIGNLLLGDDGTLYIIDFEYLQPKRKYNKYFIQNPDNRRFDYKKK